MDDGVINMPTLMVVDDDESILGLVRDIGEACGYEVATAQTTTNVIAIVQQLTPAIILLDLSIPGSDGVKLMRRLARAQCSAKIVIVSAADPKMLAACFRLGREYGLEMCAPISKPFSPDALHGFLMGARSALRRVEPQELMDALSRGEFEVRYQPKVNLRNGSAGIVGAEALLRWRHPKRGLLSANRFVPIAESEGLIEPLSSWVLAEVIAQLKAWERMGRQLVVAVNLPSTLLADLDFPDRVEAMLTHADVPAQRLMLEITERAAMQEGPTAIDVLNRLRL
jgi:sensor c-di-GMP phosphodiesterase-like protein